MRKVTALIWASIGGYTQIVEELINAGVDINIQNEEGKTALDYAKEDDESDDIVELLSK